MSTSEERLTHPMHGKTPSHGECREQVKKQNDIYTVSAADKP